MDVVCRGTKIMNTLYKVMLFVGLLLLSPALLAQANLLTNGGFETGDLTGWTAVNSGLGGINVYTGPITSNSGPIPAPPNSTYASLVNQPGPGSHILYQDVSIPAVGDSWYFSTQLFYRNAANVWADNGTLSEAGAANQHLRIDIMDPNAPVDDVGAGVWLNVFKTGGNDPFQFGFADVRVNLAQFAGQTVRIRFAEVDNQFYLDVGIDAVFVGELLVVPANNPLALTLLVLAMLLIGGFVIRRVRSNS